MDSVLSHTAALQECLLSVKDLTVGYRTFGGILTAVDKASLDLRKDEIHALIGESGCGKSTFGLALSRLLEKDQVVYSGQIIYKGTDLLSLKENEVQKYRGTEIASIFQEPMTSLNPVYRVGDQIGEALSVLDKRNKYSGHAAKSIRRRGFYQRFTAEVLELLRKVRVPDPEHVANAYPHQLSGGMRQRAMIAIALAERPSLLVADEPTTAVDVTTQVQILNLIKSLTKEFGMSTLIITHDLGIVGAVADSASVMYAGRIVEEAPTAELFANPLHPYAIGLMASSPKGRKGTHQVWTIPGIVPAIGNYPPGCRFHPRCGKAFAKCSIESPSLVEISPGHRVSCFLYGDGNGRA